MFSRVVAISMFSWRSRFVHARMYGLLSRVEDLVTEIHERTRGRGLGVYVGCVLLRINLHQLESAGGYLFPDIMVPDLDVLVVLVRDRIP